LVAKLTGYSLLSEKGIAMPFHTKEYDVYVVLSGPRTTPPWSWNKWSGIAKRLEPFTSSTRGKVSLRTTQVSKDTQKKLPFGKLGWDITSHSRWTHGSPTNAAESARWVFYSAEAWAPSWTQCEKEKDAPDFFMSLNNAHIQGESEKSQFGAKLIIALSVLESETRRADFRMAVMSISKSVASPLTVWKQRCWARPFGTVGFTDALNDLGVIGLFKVGNYHQRPLNTGTFSEDWMRLELS
jgi:hypothetical protein